MKKTKIKQIISFVFLASLVVLAVSVSSAPAEAAGNTTCPPNFTPMSGVCIPTNTGLPDPDPTGKNAIAKVLGNVFTWMMGLFGVVGMIAFVIAGTTYLTAAGDAEREKRAKRGMEVAIIGLVVGLAGLIALRTVGMLLSGT